jgi:hypothetical protein
VYEISAGTGYLQFAVTGPSGGSGDLIATKGAIPFTGVISSRDLHAAATVFTDSVLLAPDDCLATDHFAYVGEDTVGTWFLGEVDATTTPPTVVAESVLAGFAIINKIVCGGPGELLVIGTTPGGFSGLAVVTTGAGLVLAGSSTTLTTGASGDYTEDAAGNIGIVIAGETPDGSGVELFDGIFTQIYDDVYELYDTSTGTVTIEDAEFVDGNPLLLGISGTDGPFFEQLDMEFGTIPEFSLSTMLLAVLLSGFVLMFIIRRRR